MAKLFKASEAASRNVMAFSKDELLSFPEADAEGLGDGEEAVEEAVDLEALREKVLAEAREEAKRKVLEAYERGFAKGAEAGETQFLESVGAAAQALDSAAEAMRLAREQFLEVLEPQVVALSALVARKVVDRELRTEPGLIAATVRRALAALADRQKLHVRLHPHDLDALNAQKVTLLHEFGGIDEFEVHADESVTPGGCIVDTETMHVDARIETLLATVLEALEE